MITNEQIWSGVEQLAYQNGWSVSRLAKESGLDSTCFNPSKRLNGSGQARWITTESLCKVLNTTGTSFSSFAQMIEQA